MDYLIMLILGGLLTLMVCKGNFDYNSEFTLVRPDGKLLMTRDELIQAILSFNEKQLTHRFYRHGWWLTSKYLKDNKWDKELLLKTNPWSLVLLYNELYLIDVKNIRKYED